VLLTKSVQIRSDFNFLVFSAMVVKYTFAKRPEQTYLGCKSNLWPKPSRGQFPYSAQIKVIAPFHYHLFHMNAILTVIPEYFLVQRFIFTLFFDYKLLLL